MRKTNDKEDDYKTSSKVRHNKRPRRSSKTRGKSVGDKLTEGGLDGTNRDNDPNDYFTDPELARQAGQLSFQNILGAGNIVPDFGNYPMNTVPTLMVLSMDTSPMLSHRVTVSGGSLIIDRTETSGLNMMCQKTFTQITALTGRNAPYGPEDLGICILAETSFVEYVEALRRIFGIALTYNARNRVFPKAAIAALGVDADDLFKNLPAYRMRLNTIIARFNQIPIFKKVGFIKKSMGMYQKLYMDAISPMAQVYAYNPYSVWTIDETSNPLGTRLVTTPVFGSIQSASQHLDRLEGMLTALLGSSTLNVVYADMLNYANKVGAEFLTLDFVREDYVVMPEYNPNFLLQVHNMDFMCLEAVSTDILDGNGDLACTAENDVQADASTHQLIYAPAFKNTYLNASWTKPYTNIVDMINPATPIEDIIECLRFAIGWDGEQDNVSGTKFMYNVNMPDHYCRDVHIYGNAVSTGAGVEVIGAYTKGWGLYLKNSFKENWKTHYPKFDWAPTAQSCNSSETPSEVSGDFNFYTTVDHTYMWRLNRLLATGLFELR